VRFTGDRVPFVLHTCGLRLRVDRLRNGGLMTKKEVAAKLGIHESTVTRWVEHDIIKAYACSGHGWLREEPAARSHPSRRR